MKNPPAGHTGGLSRRQSATAENRSPTPAAPEEATAAAAAEASPTSAPEPDLLGRGNPVHLGPEITFETIRLGFRSYRRLHRHGRGLGRLGRKDGDRGSGRKQTQNASSKQSTIHLHLPLKLNQGNTRHTQPKGIPHKEPLPPLDGRGRTALTP
jgi:hypothetical protein